MSKIKIVSKKVIEISNTYCFEVYEYNELIFESYYYDGQQKTSAKLGFFNKILLTVLSFFFSTFKP